MKKSNYLGAMVAGFAALAGNAFGAESKPLTAADAKAKALALHPGKVLEVEKEKRKGEPVYSVEIKSEDGSVHEVTFRISDGSMLDDRARAGHEEDGDEDDDEDGENN